jgi:peptide/nickel transport system substrate-binding protein
VPKGGRLVFGLSYEPSAIDPHVNASDEGRMLDRMVFDTLVWKAPDGTFSPALATEWEISDDGKTYTFHLRDDVTFHDGTPFNAEAVKYSFDRIVDPATKSEVASSLIGPYLFTEIVDEYTVKIHLNQAFAPFLTYAALPYVGIVSPAAAEQWGEEFDDHMVGTGPFIFKEWVRGDHWRVVRNPDYNWAPAALGHQGPAYLEEILIKFIPEATVRVGTLETGETDAINDIPSLDYERIAADPSYTTYRGYLGGSPLSIAINVTLPPLDDLRVRQALEYGIDRQAIVDTLFQGLWPAEATPLSPNTLAHWDAGETMYGYDPAKAESLLEAAGWTDTNGDGIREKDGQALELWWPTIRYQRMNEMAEMVQAQLKEVGIAVKVDLVTFPAMYEAANKCEHHLVHSGFGLPDPDDLATSFLSSNVGSGWAWTCARDHRLDDLLLQGREVTDEAERSAIYIEAQQIVMDQALSVPVRLFTTLLAARADVKDMTIDFDGLVPMLYDAYVEE